MNLGLTAVTLPIDVRNGALARRSDRVSPWQVSFDREITAEDMILLHSTNKTAPDPKAPLAKIRDPHHALARMVADGKSNAEISAVYGWSPSRIATLRTDPAFAELVDHYTEEKVFANPDIDAQIRHISLAANQELMERLETDPSQFSNKELRELRDAGLDRTGHGPSRKLDVNVNDPSKVIDTLKDLIAAEGITRILPKGAIEVEYTEVEDDQAPARAGPEDSGVVSEGSVPGAEAHGVGS